MHINNISSLTAQERDKLSQVMRGFNFSYVKQSMERMNWEWGDHVPSYYEIMVVVERMLIEAIMTLSTIESGGFSAIYKDGTLMLSFTLEKKESNE